MKRIAITKALIVLLVCFLINNSGIAQVGINTPDPHSSVVLDIDSDFKGILIPRITSTIRRSYVDPQEGTLVYDRDHQMFYVYNSTGGWRPINPWKNDMSGNIRLLNDGFETDGSQVQNANIDGTMTANTFSGYGTIPLRGIIMWSGTVDEIPDGWALCNGQSFTNPTIDTPDLQGRFIVGLNGPNNYSLNTNGGADYRPIEAANLPAHTHSLELTTEITGGHKHPYQTSKGGGSMNCWDLSQSDGGSQCLNGGYEKTHADNGTEAITELSPPYYPSVHKFGEAGVHQHYISGNTQNNATSNNAFDNRPRYYVLAYIMRVK